MKEGAAALERVAKCEEMMERMEVTCCALVTNPDDGGRYVMDL